MEAAGYALTRYADDWVITCKTRREAERALTSARAVLEGELGLRVHPEKTRIVYVAQGFGTKIPPSTRTAQATRSLDRSLRRSCRPFSLGATRDQPRSNAVGFSAGCSDRPRWAHHA